MRNLDYRKVSSTFSWLRLEYQFYLLLEILTDQTYYNPGHNILKLCSILVQIRITISKTKLDI